MTSAREIRKRHKTRTFISKAQHFPEWSNPHWPAKRSGLRYGDVRSHQKRRHVGFMNGSKELNELPIDPMHGSRKEYKKHYKEDRAMYKAEKREKKLRRKPTVYSGQGLVLTTIVDYVGR